MENPVNCVDRLFFDIFDSPWIAITDDDIASLLE